MVRDCKRNELKEVAFLMKKEFNSGNYETLEKNFDSEIYKFFVLVEENKVCGFLYYLIVDYDAEIIDVMVDNEFRGKGYGEALLMFGNAEMKKIGKTGVMLEVSASNFVAQNLYKKLGFTEISRRKDYYGTEDAIVMSLKF